MVSTKRQWHFIQHPHPQIAWERSTETLKPPSPCICTSILNVTQAGCCLPQPLDVIAVGELQGIKLSFLAASVVFGFGYRWRKNAIIQAVLDGVPPTGLQLLRWERVLLTLWIKGLEHLRSEVKLSPPRGRSLKNSMNYQKLFEYNLCNVIRT